MNKILLILGIFITAFIMLATPTIARPVQEQTNMSVFENKENILLDPLKDLDIDISQVEENSEMKSNVILILLSLLLFILFSVEQGIKFFQMIGFFIEFIKEVVNVLLILWYIPFFLLWCLVENALERINDLLYD